jgi:RHS repeat-associated protein
VEKSNGSTGTIYWSMSPGIVAESDLSGNLQHEYMFFNGRRIARKDFPGGAISYYFSDDLQTASVITNAAGTITEDEDYYPWGGEVPFVNSDSNHYKFTSKERDSETGLDYFGARHYSNWLGRFITPDWSSAPVPVPYAALGDPQTLNQYTYVRNIPTSAVDPDGHFIAPTVSVNENDGLRSLQLPGTGCPSGAVCTKDPPLSLAYRFGLWVKRTNEKLDKVLAPVYQHFQNVLDLLNPCPQAGVSCGVVFPMAIGAEEDFGTLGFTRPLATDSGLQKIINKLYQDSDKVPGGTAGAVRFEKATGIKLSPAGHIQDATDTARELSNYLADHPGLSTHDQNLAKHLIQDLQNSVAGKP